MKRLTAFMITTAFIATPALATVGVQDLDVDNDDFLSYEEIVAAFPALSPEDFEQMDDNDDNRISSDEIYDTQAQDILAQHDFDPQSQVNVDADGDGFASYEEMLVVFEGLTPEDFEEMDNNDDNRLSQFEIYDTESQDILARYPFMESVADVRAIDADADNFLSFNELQLQYSGFDANDFEEIDQNDDNRISYTELYAPEAQEIISRY